MRYADLVLPEFDQEMASTRKVIERVPADKLEWRAHAKSNTIGWVANHLAERGKVLRAGEIVITGSAIKTAFPEPGDAVTYRIQGLGETSLRIEA